MAMGLKRKKKWYKLHSKRILWEDKEMRNELGTGNWEHSIDMGRFYGEYYLRR
jgi:hypothetical protein